MKAIMGFMGLFVILAFAGGYAMADQDVLAPQDFIVQVIQAVKALGGASTMVKISAVITLIISSMKVSFLNQYVWDKLGKFKIWLAPVLGLAAGIFGLGSGGEHVTPAMMFAYAAAGAGSVFVHEILDILKSIPGVGAFYLGLIDIIKGSLGGKKSE